MKSVREEVCVIREMQLKSSPVVLCNEDLLTVHFTSYKRFERFFFSSI
jgi:hypothetical protein